MKISKLHIENFRGIETLSLSDLSTLNVFTGVTGSGKTSILNAISILLSWLITKINNPKGRGEQIKDQDITKGKEYCLLEIELDNGVDWCITKDLSRNSQHIQKKKTDFGGLEVYADQIAVKLSKNEDVTLIDAYGVNRSISDIPMKKGRINRKLSTYSMSADISSNINFQEFFLWFRELEDIENERMRENGIFQHEKSLDVVRKAIKESFDGYSDFRVNRRSNAFLIKKHNIDLDFNKLSEGEKNYITLIGDIALRMSLITNVKFFMLFEHFPRNDADKAYCLQS